MDNQPGTLTDQLGKIAIQFSNLALVVSCFVTKLISDDSKIGAIVTSEMSFQNLLKVFDSLAQYRITDNGQLISIRDMIKRLNTAEQERNAILHSAYLKKDKDNWDELIRLKITAKQGKGLKITSESINSKNLKRQIKDMEDLMLELESIYKKLYNENVLQIA